MNALVKSLSARFRYVLITFVLGFSQLLPLMSMRASAERDHTPPPPTPKITICHRTDSASNPYEKNTVDESSADGIGNGDHYLEHQGPIATSTAVAQALKDDHKKWGDIIPPLDNFHSGLNWDAVGQAIYNNNCSNKGSIKIIKDAQPNDEQDFVFSTVGEDLSTFTLDDNGSESTSQGGKKSNKTFSNLESELTYKFTENQVSGWKVSDIVCSEGTVATHGDNYVSITLAPAQNVVCTFINVKTSSSITLVKVIDGSQYGDDATVDDFGLSIDGKAVNSGEGLVLSAGSYAINEEGLKGYEFVEITGDEGCPAELGESVVVEDDQNITCTIHNKAVQPTLTLVKNISGSQYGDDATANDFGLSIDSNTVKSGEATGVDIGSHTINEEGLKGYEFVEITGDEGCPAELGGSVPLSLGENITCTITNKAIAPEITIFKVISGNTENSYDFEATYPGLESPLEFSLDGSGNEGSSAYRFYPNVGDVKISEITGSDWFSRITCYDSKENIVFDKLASEVTLDTELGSRYYCTFRNTEKATITIVKFNDANGNGVMDEGELPLSGWDLQANITGDGGEFTETKSATTGEDGTVTFDVLGEFAEAEGLSFTTSETLKAGWTQTGMYCGEPTLPAIDVVNEVQLLDVQSDSNELVPGGSYTCYIGNKKKVITDVLSETITKGTLSNTGANSTSNLMLALTILVLAVLSIGLKSSEKQSDK